MHSYGETITGESWLMRDIWQTTNIDYGAKWGLATNPKKLKRQRYKTTFGTCLMGTGDSSTSQRRYKTSRMEAAHGFRKFYKSHAEQVMRPINVEITMGHNIGLSASYYKPTENQVLEDYLKATDLLTISNDKVILKKEVAELQQKSKNNEYIIRGKLQEKDEEMKTMKEQVNTMQSQLQILISTLGSIKDQNQVNQTAQMLYKSGILNNT